MRRFNCGLTTEHHPLYGIFCAKLSSCIFAWDQEDVQRLKEAKRAEWKSSPSGHTPTEEQLMATISPGELKRHCRRRTRGVEEIRGMISGLLEQTDTTGLRLVSHDSMRHVWEVQQKHLECLQDPAGVALYTKVGTLQKGGKELDILRCGRSSSLESFHRHQCAFIPGWRCNAVHTQMYILEGVSRWNMGRAKEAIDVEGASTLRSFDAPPLFRGHAFLLRGDCAIHTSQCDSRGVVGWDAVDNLAGYLVGLNRTITALSLKEEADIVQLYTALHDMDKKHLSYTQKARKKRTGIRRTMESTEEAEWLCSWRAGGRETIHDSRPSSPGSRTPQGHHIRQLLEDSRVIVVQTALALVPVNNTTVSAWLLRRDKRKDRNMLLQGNVLLQQLYLAKDPLPSINTLPAAPVQHAHEEGSGA
ncbi:unnamed protein product [Arctogadus glacialis]